MTRGTALVLTCWQRMQGPAFGGPPNATQMRLSRWRLFAAPGARLWNRQPSAPGEYGTFALRGYGL